MSFGSFVKAIVDAENSTEFNDWGAFLASISFPDDVSLFQSFCITHTSHANLFARNYSWELFDTLCCWLLDDAINASLLVAIRNIVKFLSCNVRPRELYIMTVEKLFGCSSNLLLEVLLFSLQLAIVGSNSLDILNAGLTVVLKKCTQMCIPIGKESPADWDDVVEDEEDDDARSRADTTSKQRVIAATVDALLTFHKGVASNQLDWMDKSYQESNIITSASLPEDDRQRKGMSIGFLSCVSSQCVALLTDPVLRGLKMNAVTAQMLTTSSDPRELFAQARRDRGRMFYIGKRETVRRICSNKNNKQTDDALVDNISAENDHQFAEYLQKSNDSENQQSFVSKWQDSVPWDQVTDEALRKVSHVSVPSSLHGSQSATDSEAHSSDKYSSVNYFGGVTEGPLMSTTLPWSITGIAMAFHCVLRDLLHDEALVVGACLFPRVFSARYLLGTAGIYQSALIRNPQMATFEGLRFSCGLGDLLSAVAVHPSDRRLFTPFGTPLNNGEGTRQMMNAFYSTHSESFPRKAALVFAKACSTDMLSVYQATITALASCTDTQLRMDSLTAMRVSLRRVEERSLFALLVKLTDQCPFLSITGLLIDIQKECAQAASLGKIWGLFAFMPSQVSVLNGVDWSRVFQTNSGVSILNLVFTNWTRGDDSWVAFRQSIADVTVILRDHASSTHPTKSDSNSSSASKRYEDNNDRRLKDEQQQRAKSRLEGLIFSWGVSSEGRGSSPWWSPIVLRSVVLTRLEEFAALTSRDALLDSVDVVGSVVNLVQFVALRLAAGITFDTEGDESCDDPQLSNDVNGRACLWQYFSGCNAETITAIAALQDLVYTSRLMTRLQRVTTDLLAESTVRAKGRQSLDLLKMQLLAANVVYAAGRMEQLSSALCWVVSHHGVE